MDYDKDLVTTDSEEASLVEVQKANAALVARQVAEVQASIQLAKEYPRDILEVRHEIAVACGRMSLAEKAIYNYPRGGTMVNGASIRLMEAISLAWGNMASGVREIKRGEGFSEMQSYAWDMQKNNRQSREFTVPHVRYSSAAGIVPLIDPRNIYENNANDASRRLRVCLMAIIPKDIIDEALEIVQETLDKPPEKHEQEKRIDGMIAAFEKYGVSKFDIEKKMIKEVERFTNEDIINMLNIFNSIKDGIVAASDVFGETTGRVKRTSMDVTATPADED